MSDGIPDMPRLFNSNLLDDEEAASVIEEDTTSDSSSGSDTENDGKKKKKVQKKKKRVHKKVYDVEPERDEVVMYSLTSKKRKAKSINKRSKNPVKGMTYYTERRQRRDSRRTYRNAVLREAWHLKMVSNDDVYVTFKNAEKKKEQHFSTARNFKFRSWDENTTTEDNLDPAVVPLNSTAIEPSSSFPSPSCFELARISPSKQRRGKETARTMMQKDKTCAKCGIVHGTPRDSKLKSLWIGCDGIKNGMDCNHWVHAGCLGFPDATKNQIEDMTYLWPDHNTDHTDLVDTLKNLTNLENKRKKNRTSRIIDDGSPTVSVKQ